MGVHRGFTELYFVPLTGVFPTDFLISLTCGSLSPRQFVTVCHFSLTPLKGAHGGVCGINHRRS